MKPNTDKTYIAIDLKSFYASVECLSRGLDPLTTNLVVADSSRTEKTICLAVTPALKSYGIPGRARLFEVVQKVKEANSRRKYKAKKRELEGKSISSIELNNNPKLAIDYIVAPPRMAYYMDVSIKVYNVYLKYIAKEDIVVYSIDEVFIDATNYLKLYGLSAEELARKMIKDVLDTVGVTATAGIGTNLYLCKIAMDVMAKHMEPDENGVRIASLDEMTYRQKLWNHTPLTDFWRVGKGYAKKLQAEGIMTMGDIARISLNKSSSYLSEKWLYKQFGVSAELLIDHAWGYEPCTMDYIKNYYPENQSICSGQVLQEPYTYEKTLIVVKEMTEALSLDITSKGLVTNQLVLTIGYDIVNLTDPDIKYKGEITTDTYGRKIPKHAHGTVNLPIYTASTRIMLDKIAELFVSIVNPSLMVRRINISANHVLPENKAEIKKEIPVMDSLFGDTEDIADNIYKEDTLKKEKSLQKAMLSIKGKFGKNAILKANSLQEGATMRLRNQQVGGHKA